MPGKDILRQNNREMLSVLSLVIIYDLLFCFLAHLLYYFSFFYEAPKCNGQMGPYQAHGHIIIALHACDKNVQTLEDFDKFSKPFNGE